MHGIGEPALYQGQSLPMPCSSVTMLGSSVWSRLAVRHLPALYIGMIRRRIVKLLRRHAVQRIYAHIPTAALRWPHGRLPSNLVYP